MKILVTAGGTMGHINPALAIIDEFKKHEPNLEVIYIGTTNRMEKDIIPKFGYKYIGIEIYGLTKNIIRDIKNIFLINKAYKKSLSVIKEEKPDVVIGVGGYVTYPVLKAAHKLGIKTFIHEQNSIPGKTNRAIAKYANLIGVTFDTSAKYFNTDGKIIYTGHPSGTKAKEMPKMNKEAFGLSKNKKLVTFVAGSLGSGSLNNKLLEYLKSIDNRDYEIVYIAGKNQYKEFSTSLGDNPNIKLLEYLDNLPGLLKISNVVVSRAGAGSLSELMALEIPSIIIPSPNVANNHQYFNAKELKDKNCIVLLEEKNITKDIIEKEVDDLLKNENKREIMIQAMRKLNVIDASSIIYQEIRKMIDETK